MEISPYIEQATQYHAFNCNKCGLRADDSIVYVIMKAIKDIRTMNSYKEEESNSSSSNE